MEQATSLQRWRLFLARELYLHCPDSWEQREASIHQAAAVVRDSNLESRQYKYIWMDSWNVVRWLIRIDHYKNIATHFPPSRR